MINTSELIRLSMLSKDKEALTAYRSIKAKEAVYLTAKKGNVLTNEIQKSLIKKEIKERKEASEFLDKEFNLNVASILNSFLPKPLCYEEIKEQVMLSIYEIGLSSPADFGKIMKHLNQNSKEIDMKIASNLLRELLK